MEYKIINYGQTVAGESDKYRTNHVSKENFYKRFGRFFSDWDEEELNRLKWRYVKPCVVSPWEKQYFGGKYIPLHIFYNDLTDSYNITTMENVSPLQNVYELKYKKSKQ